MSCVAGCYSCSMAFMIALSNKTLVEEERIYVSNIILKLDYEDRPR